MVAVGSRDDVVVARLDVCERRLRRGDSGSRGGAERAPRGYERRDRTATLSTFATTRRVPTLSTRVSVRRRAKEARSRTRRLPRRQRLSTRAARRRTRSAPPRKRRARASFLLTTRPRTLERTSTSFLFRRPVLTRRLDFLTCLNAFARRSRPRSEARPTEHHVRSVGHPPRRGGGGCRRGGRRRDPRVPLLGRARPRRRSNQATFVVERGKDTSARAKRLVSSDAAGATAVSETAASGARAVATGAGTAATTVTFPVASRAHVRCVLYDADGEPVVIDERARFGAEALFLSSLASSALAVAVTRALAARDARRDDSTRDVASEASRDLEGIARGIAAAAAAGDAGPTGPSGSDVSARRTVRRKLRRPSRSRVSRPRPRPTRSPGARRTPRRTPRL